MPTHSTVTRDGRLAIPKQIRQHFRLAPGDRVSFSILSDGSVVLRAMNRRVADLAGILRRQGQPTIPIESMRIKDSDDV
ncbi:MULTISPECIES: AbrB/MazE/SpoVT family DNA-binding domain-containing protein [Achromobacter]|uniref:AbrB/MazE/SpoVT family DNA-binding domain-containing protein n=1 Tax=Achromobacter sp. GbtcB20 TaxID=2824765 RepID=UPI001266D1E2